VIGAKPAETAWPLCAVVTRLSERRRMWSWARFALPVQLVIASVSEAIQPQSTKPWIASSRSRSSGRPLRAGPVGSSQ
jgi:hypothetical protein